MFCPYYSPHSSAELHGARSSFSLSLRRISNYQLGDEISALFFVSKDIFLSLNTLINFSIAYFVIPMCLPISAIFVVVCCYINQLNFYNCSICTFRIRRTNLKLIVLPSVFILLMVSVFFVLSTTTLFKKEKRQ